MDILEVCSNIIIRASAPVDAKFLSILQKKKKTCFFLFYTSTFTKHPYQFVYSIYLFDKIFILESPHSIPLSLSQTQHYPK